MNSSKSLNFLYKNGFVIVKSNKIEKLKNKIKNELINNINFILKRKNINNPEIKKFDDLIKYIFKIDKKKNLKIFKSLYELFPSNLLIYNLACEKFFITLCKNLGIKHPIISTGPQLRIDRPKDNKFKTLKHQDFWYSFLSDNSLTLWFNLTNIETKDGPLIIYKESHKFGLLKFRDKKKGTFEIKKPFKIKADKIYLKKNEILIFNQYLVHESGQNISSKPRVTIQLRYNDLHSLKKLTSSFKFSSSDFVLNKQKYL